MSFWILIDYYVFSRLLPTAPCIARVLESDFEYENYRLPKGVIFFWHIFVYHTYSSSSSTYYVFIFQSVVLLHTWLACLDDKNFADASSYKPERWLDDLTRKSPFLIVPFGCGKRMCPGKRFVELELQIVLAKVS